MVACLEGAAIVLGALRPFAPVTRMRLPRGIVEFVRVMGERWVGLRRDMLIAGGEDDILIGGCRCRGFRSVVWL